MSAAETISISDYHRAVANNKNPEKMARIICHEFEGINFETKVARDYYATLRRRELHREVYGIKIKPAWNIVINGMLVYRIEACFSFYEGRERRLHVVDVTGAIDAHTKLKRKLLHACHGIQIEVPLWW